MTLTGTMVLLVAGGLAVVGCSRDGAPATCEHGQPCDSDGGPPAEGGSPADGGSPETCGNVQPCSGDVVGSWTFTETCQSSARFAASAMKFSTMAEQSWCPGQTLVGIEPAAAGSLILDAAGSYTLAVEFGGYIDINYPASCIAGASCDDATAGFQAQIDAGTFPNPSVTSIACAGSSSCRCHAAVNNTQYASGTYALSGNVLIFTAATGVVTNKGYCIVGNKLHILDTSTGSTGQTAIDSDLVAMKP